MIAMLTGLLQPSHIIVVLVVALLVFGPKPLPEDGRSLGHGMRELKGSLDSHHDDAEATTPSAAAAETAPPAATAATKHHS